MHRITVSLPDEVVAAVQREARRSGKSVSAVTRDAICSHLHLVVDPGQTRSFGIIGIGQSDPREGGKVASRVDEILAEEWTLDRDR